MSIFKEYNYLAANVNNLTYLILPTANTPITLNGILGKNKSTINLKDDYTFVPRITLTSGANLSGVNFTIKGKNNGISIIENILGPNANTVVTVNCFDFIENIISDTTLGFGEDMSIGTSGVGYFPLIRLNTLKQNVTNLNYSLNMIVDAANPATYQVFLSLEDSYNQGTYDSLTVANNNFIAPAIASNVSALLNYTQLASNILIKVTPNANGTNLKAQFMQV